MTVVIGTAGHIDHGKTALLRALTGIDADRLPEERRRGMTIDVGYAHLRLADGTDLDFVDVPGHDRLVGNMLVGAGEIQAALLVVAADDGPRAQTLEHLELLDGLEVHNGIVALTKIDAVDPARITEVTALIRAMLAGTSLEDAPILPVSSIAGTGLGELLAELGRLRDRVVQGAPQLDPGEPVRLPIDRTFTVKGRGTVITGSLRGGRLERAALLRLVPGGREVRAREVQVHGATVDAVDGGGRVAINLAGIDSAELARGAVLTTDPRVLASPAVIAVLRPPAGSGAARGWPPAPGATARLHLGTEQAQATLGRGRADLVPLADGRIVARVRLARPIAVAEGDRFVLRRSGTGRRAIGGTVLDPDPPTGPSRRRADPDRLAGLASAAPADRAHALVALHGVLDPERLPSGVVDAAVAGAIRIAGLVVDGPIVAALGLEAVGAVARQGTSAGSPPGISRAELRASLVRSLRRLATVDLRRAGPVVDGLIAGLVAAGRLARDGDRILEPGMAVTLPVAAVAAMDRLERLLSTPTPPGLADALRSSGCPPEGLRALDATGRIVRLEADLAYSGATYWELARAALRMAATTPLTPASLRDATGTSRKYVMAILEDLDRRGVLRRTAEGHVPGPRAALADRPATVAGP